MSESEALSTAHCGVHVPLICKYYNNGCHATAQSIFYIRPGVRTPMWDFIRTECRLSNRSAIFIWTLAVLWHVPNFWPNFIRTHLRVSRLRELLGVCYSSSYPCCYPLACSLCNKSLKGISKKSTYCSICNWVLEINGI